VVLNVFLFFIAVPSLILLNVREWLSASGTCGRLWLSCRSAWRIGRVGWGKTEEFSHVWSLRPCSVAISTNRQSPSLSDEQADAVDEGQHRQKGSDYANDIGPRVTVENEFQNCKYGNDYGRHEHIGCVPGHGSRSRLARSVRWRRGRIRSAHGEQPL
jgi:hypothetical protein